MGLFRKDNNQPKERDYTERFEPKLPYCLICAFIICVVLVTVLLTLYVCLR